MAAPTFVASSSVDGASTSVAIPAPTGVQSGDFQIAIIGVATGSETVTTPSGWTSVATLANNAGDSFSTHVFVSTTVTGSQTFTKSGSRGFMGIRVAYRGTQGAQASSYSLVATGPGTSHAISQRSVNAADSLVIGAVHLDGTPAAGASFTAPTNWTERVDRFNTNEDQVLTVADFVATSAGNVNGTFTSSASDDGNTFAMVLTPGGGLSANVGRVTESDTAQAFTIRRNPIKINVGQAVENNAPFPITRSGAQSIPVGQAVEADAARPITEPQSGTSAPVFVASSTATSTVNDVVIPAPSGVQSGDYQLAFIGIATGGEVVTTVPSGWTQIATIANNSTDSFSLHVFESTTSTTDAVFVRSGSRGAQGVRAAWRGHGGVGSPTTQTTASGTLHAIPTQTVTVDNSVVIGLAHTDGTPLTFTPPSGWTERVETTPTAAVENQVLTIAEITASTQGGGGSATIPLTIPFTVGGGSGGSASVDGEFTSSVVEPGITFAIVLDGGVTGPKYVPVGQAVDTEVAQTVTALIAGERLVNVGRTTETETAQAISPRFRKFVPVGRAQDLSTTHLIGMKLTRGGLITLDTIWLHSADSPEDYLKFPNTAKLTVTTAPRGSVRRLAGGRLRSVTQGNARTADLSMPGCDRAQIRWLEQHVGETVLIRDDRGRKLFGTYTSVAVSEMSISTDLGEASVNLAEVRHSESV